MVNEDAFKNAAIRLQSHFSSMKTPKTNEKKSQVKFQSEMIIHKRRI